MDNITCETLNYVYLIQEREFIKTRESIYRIGTTRKLGKFSRYPKGSILMFQIYCGGKNIESKILKIFRQKFTCRRDIGTDYFQGNYSYMIDIIYSIVKQEHVPQIIGGIYVNHIDRMDID